MRRNGYFQLYWNEGGKIIGFGFSQCISRYEGRKLTYLLIVMNFFLLLDELITFKIINRRDPGLRNLMSVRSFEKVTGGIDNEK